MPSTLPPRMRGPLPPPTSPRSESRGGFTHESIRAAWCEYRRSRCEMLRTKLILHYMQGHVRRIASRLHKLLPHQVDFEDLVQQGYLGLIDAMDRFDPERDVTFETFSSRRVAGAMHDYLRKVDHLPRLTRTRLKAALRTEDEFRKRHGRAPSEDELRQRMGVTHEAFRRYQSDRMAATPATIHLRAAAEGPGAGPEDEGPGALIDRRQEAPLVEVARRNVRGWIGRGLDHRDRLIVLLYYYEHLTMREVGAAIGISESRVSQRLELIHERIRSRLSLSEAERELVYS